MSHRDTVVVVTILLTITSLSVIGFTDYATKPEIETVEDNPADYTGDSSTTINYSDLPESQQQNFRERIATGERVEVDTPPGTTQVQLDGRYYDTTYKYGDNRGFGAYNESALVMMLSLVLLAIATIGVLGVRITGILDAMVVVVVLAVCLIAIVYAQAAFPAQAEFMVSGEPVESVSEGAVVVNASSFGQMEYQAFLKSTADGSAFLPAMDPDVEYVRSDGEYYPVSRTEATVSMSTVEWVAGGAWVAILTVMLGGLALDPDGTSHR